MSLIVADNGGGVDEKHLKHLTDRFYRVYGHDKSGSGLGLNIVSQLVDLHKGSILLQNATHHTGSKGLVCTLTFPEFYS